MQPTISDTDPSIEEIRMNMLRGATIAERFGRMRSLSTSVIELSRRALRRAHPYLCEEEIGLLFVEFHYGKELADQVRHYVKAQNR